MNIGAEAYDYNKVTDARAGDNVVGNVGYITRNVGGNNFGMEFGFGRESIVPLEILAALATGSTEGYVSIETLRTFMNAIYDDLSKFALVSEVNKVLQNVWTVDSMQAFINNAIFQKLRVTKELRIPEAY